MREFIVYRSSGKAGVVEAYSLYEAIEKANLLYGDVTEVIEGHEDF